MWKRTERIGIAVCATMLLSGIAPAQRPKSPRRVSIVVDSKLGPPAAHGLERLANALASKQIRVERRDSLRRARRQRVIVLGLSASSEAVEQLRSAAGLSLPSEPEGLLVKKIRWNGKDVLLICGADDRGLMYATMDVARQIELAGEGADLFGPVREVSEEPDVRERGLSKIVMSQSEFEKYFYSEQYWAKYLDLLASSRFNNFVLMFGWGSSGYLSPPYPFLFDTDGFTGIRVVGITPEQQERNLQALRGVIRMTHERGMEFTLALWTHIYRIKEQTPGLIWGLTDDNLIPYTKAALKQFLERVPGIDRIQFRVHTESALELPQQIPFWRMIFDVIEQSGQPIKVDMRAKGYNDDMIDASLSSPLLVRVATKYWGENMGMPYHPLHVEWRNQYDRRHGYADMLRYPKRYDMLWRLWNCGTTRVLLWGGREYARRFAESSHLYDSPGYEVNEPLAYKGSSSRKPAYEILNKQYRYYDWEFERYWYFYEVFGRLGYDPKLTPEFWRPEFEKRFGEKAAPAVQRAYETASHILPRITAYNLVDLSSGRTWAEKERWGDLPEFASAPPSDTGQFVGIAEAAKLYVENKPSARIWPQRTARWFASTGRQVIEAVAEAEASAGANPGKEFISTMIDMKVLGNLALYHSRRIPAGVSYALFEHTQDLNALDDAIRHEKEAIGIWEKIAKLTDGVYNDNLVMGRRLKGHWKDELVALRRGLSELERQGARFTPEFRKVERRIDFGDAPPEEGYLSLTSQTGQRRFSPLTGGYGWLRANLLPGSDSHGKLDFVHGPPPDRYTRSAFVVEVPNGNYELRFTMQDTSADPQDYGPMWIEVEGRYSTGQFSVSAGKKVERTVEAEAVDGKLGLAISSATGAQWLLNDLVITRIGPGVAHVPVRRARPGHELIIRATAAGPSPIRRMNLVYRATNGGDRTVEMSRAGNFRYSATIPGSDVAAGLVYFLEAEDRDGRLVRQATIHVAVSGDRQPPEVRHVAVRQATGGEPLVLRAEVVDPSGVKSVSVRCRSVTQYQEYATIPMLPTGSGNVYVAKIPGKYLDPRWDFMYLIEAVDTEGNGTMYPDVENEAPYIVVSLRR